MLMILTENSAGEVGRRLAQSRCKRLTGGGGAGYFGPLVSFTTGPEA